MTQPRTAWHYCFWLLLRERGSKRFEIRAEVPIGKELPRADYLLLRKAERPGLDDAALTLTRLWPQLPRETVAELKSTGQPYRRRDLFKLLAYAYRYYATAEALVTLDELACVLLVPSRNGPLLDDIEGLDLSLAEAADGYHRIHGQRLAIHLVELDRVTEVEDDDVLRLFSRHRKRTLASRRWWARWVGGHDMKVQELEGHDEVIAKLLRFLTPEQRLAVLAPEELLDSLTPEQRLAGLEPEQRLAGLEPEQRLAGLEPEQRLAGLDGDQLLRGLSRNYLDSLPQDLRDAIEAHLKTKS